MNPAVNPVVAERMPAKPGAHPARAILVRSLQLAHGGLQGLGTAGFVLCGGGERGPGPRWQRALGRGVVRAATRLGSTFIKVGQIASTREDLLPRAITQELMQLQDAVAPFPFAQARARIEAELGAPLPELFASFDPVPMASASVSQVHAARLPDGREVAVKVRRPDIVERVALDRSILLALARAAERLVPSLRLMSVEEALANFCEAVEEQLDFEREARNNQRFQANFAGDPSLGFPALIPERCSGAVLTMELVAGLHERDLDPSAFDLPALVGCGMRAVCRMIFQHGFVHADLHPGNIRFLPPDRMVLLDLGLVGELTDEDRHTTAQLLHALVTGDGRTVAELFYVHAPHHAVRDYAAYEREMSDFVESVRHKGLGQLHVTIQIARIFDILRRHRIQARAHMTVVNLALLTAEGLGKRLAPELDLTHEALPYLVEALAKGPGTA